MMEFSGSVLIRVLDIETLELIEEIEQKNVITKNFYYNWLNAFANTSFGNNIYISTNSNPHYEDYPGMSGAITNGTIPVGITSPIQIGSYIQVMRRFNPGGSTRIITTIGLGDNTSFSFNQSVCAYVSLTSPCTQTTSQILDVYYRINGVPSTANSYNYFGAHPTTALGLMFGTNAGNSGYLVPSPGALVPLYSHVTDSSSIAPTSLGFTKFYNQFTSLSVGTKGTSSTSYESSHGMIQFNWSYSTTQGIGDLHGSLMVGNLPGATYLRNTTTMNITAPNGSKIQPIFSHAAATLTSSIANPFLDSQPSTGTGTFNMTGTWTPGNLPELYKIDIVTGGAVGTATYKFSKRNHFGFFGPTYNSMPALLPGAFNYATGFGKPHTVPLGSAGTNTDIVLGGYGSRLEKYSKTSVIMYDQTGVSRYNCVNHSIEIWDAYSTPALLATNIRQVAVKPDDGTIWVACANTGIYEISADGLTITNFTTANGLISNSVYGIDIGRNNAVWAVCNGGIVTSPDNGLNWTIYNQTPSPNSDPFFNSVDTLLHLNSLIDVKGHIINAFGNAQISSVQSKFGGSSAVFAASTDYMLINPAPAPFYMFNLEEFTIELWIYPTAIGGARIKRYISSDTTSVGFCIRENSSNILEAYVTSIDNQTKTATSTVAPTLNTWQHLALVVRNRIITLYKNGVLIATSSSPLTNNVNVNTALQPIKLSGNSGTDHFIGYMDEIRITRDVGRYSSNFTPAIAEFPEIQGNPVFDSSVLNGDFQSIHYLRVDPTHPDDRLALVRSGNTPLNPSIGLIWWSRVSSVAIQNTEFTQNTVLMDPRRTPACFNVSDTDSLWMAIRGSSTLTKLYYGLTTGSNVNVSGANPVNSVNFVRNSTNTQDLLMTINDKETKLYNNGLVNIATVVPPSTTWPIATSYVDGSYVHLGSGIVAVSGPYLGIAWIFSLVGDGKPVSSSIGYLMWENYGWDGAQWVLDHTGSKPTHAGDELMLHGINANFVNGVSGTSFIAGDYYTASVNDGILKNNAMTITGSSKHFVVPTKKLTDFDGVVRLYPWTTGIVTWRKVSASLTINGDNSVSCNIPFRTAYLTAGSKNRVFGDFNISGTFNIVSPLQIYDIGIKSFNETEIPTWNINKYSDFSFKVSGNAVNIMNNAGTALFVCPSIGGTTTWSIVRTGSSLQFFTAGVLRYTTTSSIYSFIINARFQDTTTGSPFTVNQVTVNSSGTGYYVGLGNTGTGTGIYDTKQLCANVLKNTDILINAVPIQTIFTTPASTPIAGAPAIDRECGMLFFDPTDAGKTLTGEYLMSYQVSTSCNIIPV